MRAQDLGYALLICGVYAAFCGWIAWSWRRQQQAAQQRALALLPAAPGQEFWWVCHASQTGQAEELATQTAQLLHQAGVPVRLQALGQLTAEDLRQAQRLLCIASTYGEGDPPDSAMLFMQRLMTDAALDLSQLHVGVLALGDRTYTQFCGFGRALASWLGERGAKPLFESIEVDRNDAAALQQWREHLARLAGTSDLPDWQAPAYERWLLQARRHLNPDSLGEPVHHLELRPAPGQMLPDWQAGDLVQIEVPSAIGAPRDYSIASVPADGALHLLVRRTRRSDGSPGLASAWLTQGLEEGGELNLRLRAHTGFRIGGNDARPLILIGNGTGLAGLRAHMRARLDAAGHLADADRVSRPASVAPMWLLFGERQSQCDAYYREEIEAWAHQGWLSQLDWVFSRDQAERRYVQHALMDAAGRLRVWVLGGAAIYVCGSLEGMAAEVDAALIDILGESQLQQLLAEGRYRRDVY